MAVGVGRPAGAAAAADTGHGDAEPPEPGASKVRKGPIAMADKRAMRKVGSTWERRFVAMRIVRSLGLLPS